MWAMLEAGMSIVAASLPALRSLFKGYFDGSQNQSQPSHGRSNNSKNVAGASVVTTSEPKATRMAKLTREGKEWEQLSDDSSQRGIVHETVISVRSERAMDV